MCLTRSSHPPAAPPAAGRQVAMLREQQRALVRELRPNALALVSWH